MDWDELYQVLEDRLSETLASGGAEGPDQLLEAESGALLLKAIEAADMGRLLTLCIHILDELYQAKRDRGHYWIDLMESKSVLALRQELLGRADKAELARKAALADYELGEMLRIGRHVTPDAPAMLRYASAVRSAYSPTSTKAYTADCRVAHLDLIYRTRRPENAPWVDVLWEVCISCMESADDASWPLVVEQAIAGRLPEHPVVEAAERERTETDFEGLDVSVVTAEGITLTGRQRETLSRVVGRLGASRAVALIGDRTCIALDPAEARYGFDYLVESVREEVSTYEYRPPEQHATYLGDGRHLVYVFGTLLQLVERDECPVPPGWMEEGAGIPLPIALAHRDKALVACADPLVLAASIPNTPLPEHGSHAVPDLRVAICARDGYYPAPERLWEYDYDTGDSWDSDDGRLPAARAVGLMHWGEGAEGNRYGSDSFIAHRGNGYVSGAVTDAAGLLPVLRGEASVVIETNENIPKWEYDDGDVRFDWPHGEVERIKGLLAGSLDWMGREEESIVADIAIWEEFLKEDALDEFPDEGVAYDLEELRKLRRRLESVRHSLDKWRDLDELLKHLQGLRVGSVIERDCPLLEVGTISGPIRSKLDGEVEYFRYGDGPKAIREILDNAGIDVEGTLDNVRRLCATPERTYLNPEASAMKELLEGLVAAEEAELSDEQRRRLQRISEEVRENCALRKTSILAQEARRQGYISSQEKDDQSLWSSVDREVIDLLAHSPQTLNDTYSYLECLDAIYREFGSSGCLGHHHDMTPDSAYTIRWHIWRYLHSDDPACEMLSDYSAEYAPSAERQGSVSHLWIGAPAIVTDGPLSGRRVVVVSPCDKQGRVTVEMHLMGQTSRLKVEGKSLSALVRSLPDKIDVDALPSSVDDSQRVIMQRSLDALAAFACHSPAREDIKSASSYLLSAVRIIRNMRRFIHKLNNDSLSGLEMDGEIGSLRHSIIDAVISSGLYDELEEFCTNLVAGSIPRAEHADSDNSFPTLTLDGSLDEWT